MLRFAQKKSRMQRGERRHFADRATIAQPSAPQPHDAFADAEQRLGGGAAEQHQHLRRHELDLPREERRAGLDLLGSRRAVAWRTPIDSVGDVDVSLVKTDRGKHAVEQLAGAADKGPALQILVAAGRFADQHDAGFIAAALEAEALRRALERAAVESGDDGFKLGEGRRFSR